MPWYRIYADHGPGHQSSTEKYRFFEKALVTSKMKQEAWEEEFANGNYDWPIGDVELIKKLPQHIHASKVELLQQSIKQAQSMLKVLAVTPTKPVIAVQMVVVPDAQPQVCYQARLLADEKVKGPMRPTREKAAAVLIRQLKGRKTDYAVITR